MSYVILENNFLKYKFYANFKLTVGVLFLIKITETKLKSPIVMKIPYPGMASGSEGGLVSLLKLGIKNRKGRDFYTIEEKIFEEAVHLHMEEIAEQSREEVKLIMNKFEKIMGKYNEKVLEGETKFKEAGERLQRLKNVTEHILEKTGENEENGD